MNVNSTHKCLLDTMHWVWDLSKFKNRDTKTMSVMSFWCLVNFGQAFAPFLLLLFFTLNIFCLLWMSLNATLWYIFVKHQIDVIFMEVVAKHYITLNTKGLKRVTKRIHVRITYILHFTSSSQLVFTCSKLIMKSERHCAKYDQINKKGIRSNAWN